MRTLFFRIYGRTAIYEHLDQTQLDFLLKDNGKLTDNFKSLFQASLERVEAGETTLQEVYSVIGQGE